MTIAVGFAYIMLMAIPRLADSATLTFERRYLMKNIRRREFRWREAILKRKKSSTNIQAKIAFFATAIKGYAIAPPGEVVGSPETNFGHQHHGDDSPLAAMSALVDHRLKPLLGSTRLSCRYLLVAFSHVIYDICSTTLNRVLLGSGTGT